VTGNYQRNRRHQGDLDGITTLRVEILGTHGIPRAHIYAVRIFGE
jgi:hypothetical protein